MNDYSFEGIFIPLFILSLLALALAGIVFLAVRINHQDQEAKKGKPKSKYETILQYVESTRVFGIILAGLGLYSYYINREDNPANALPIAAAIGVEAILILAIGWLLKKRHPLVALPFGLSVGMLGAVPLVKQFDYAIPIDMIFIFLPLMTAGILFTAWRQGYFSQGEDFALTE